MKIIYWNIGERYTDHKEGLLDELIVSKDPNIVCIAEGTYSQEECSKIEEYFSKNQFNLYYTPNIGKSLNMGYGYVKNGLKVFYKDIDLVGDFEFQHQREKGRIVKIDFLWDSTSYSIFFVHNFSKSGNREVTDQQRLFISTINQFLEGVKNTLKNPVILGDFNVEPWDNILRTSGYIKSHFLTKHHQINSRNSKNSLNLYTPIAEAIIKSDNKNLGGTYYSNNNGWALFDFPIFDKNELNIEYDILTKTNKRNILTDDYSLCLNLVLESIDHLPIMIKLNPNEQS